MDIIVFDTSFNEIGIADVYDSLIWTDRYNECGDFEICTAATYDMISLLKQNYYLKLTSSKHVMIIEKIEIDSNIEEGPRLIVSGRSLESILDRRIIWKKRIFSNADFETMIHDLLDENIIAPTADTGGTDRKISNFIFAASSPAITGLDRVDAQFNGDNLYDVIKDLCVSRNLGFKITLNSSNKFVFQLYKGVNRSYSQTENDFVVFSPTFDNLISSNYYYSNEKYKNAALVGGAEPTNDADLLDFENVDKTHYVNVDGSKDSYTLTGNAGKNSYLSYVGLTKNIGGTVYLSGTLERFGTHPSSSIAAVRVGYTTGGTTTWPSGNVAEYDATNKVELIDVPINIASGIDSYEIAVRVGRTSSQNASVKVNGLKLYDTYDRRIYASVGTASGLQRREMFVDESGTSQDSANYLSELASKGFTELSENLESIGYEGEAEMSQQFVYGRDFTIGDIVQVDDGYGHYGSVVVSEVVISENEEGLSTFPTFLSFQMEEEGTN